MTADRTPEDCADQGANLDFDPEADDRAAYVRALIAARAPEISAADLALLGDAPDPDTLPASIGQQILEVLDHMMTRMDALERAVRAG